VERLLTILRGEVTFQMISKMSYFVEEGFHNIFKSKIEALSSITTISICIFIIGIMYMTFSNLSNTIEKIQNDLTINVYLDSSTSKGNAEALKKHLLTNNKVVDVEIYTKEQALIEFAKEIENGDNLLEQYKDDNPLRDSLRIKIKEQADIEGVVEMLNESSFVKRIVKPNDAVKFLTKLNSIVQVISMIFIVILISMSVVLIVNTIKLTVYIRKNDIQIMKYVGATDWFVRIPFIVEGVLIGIIGTIIPLVILYFVYGAVYNTVAGNSADALYKWISLRTSGEIYAFLIPLCIFIGIGIGTAGSMISIRKYLEV